MPENFIQKGVREAKEQIERARHFAVDPSDAEGAPFAPGDDIKFQLQTETNLSDSEIGTKVSELLNKSKERVRTLRGIAEDKVQSAEHAAQFPEDD